MGKKEQRKSPAGRPPKFAEASCPVTVTLPLRTLDALQRIDKDRAKAIVSCVNAVVEGENAAPKGVEIVTAFEGFSLIIVPPCPCLDRLERLRLVEIAPDRFLLVVAEGYSVQMLELDLLDLMEDLAPEAETERRLLTELKLVLSRHRRQESIKSGQILLLAL